MIQVIAGFPDWAVEQGLLRSRPRMKKLKEPRNFPARLRWKNSTGS
jgi:hypothetical protein